MRPGNIVLVLSVDSLASQGEVYVLVNGSSKDGVSIKIRVWRYSAPRPRNNRYNAQKMKFSIKQFFSKCDQIRRKLWTSSHLLKKSIMKNFTFCAVVELQNGYSYLIGRNE